MEKQTICLTPLVSGVGGMVSFRYKLTAGLEARGYQVTENLEDPDMSALLVIGGTRNLAGLRQVKRRGIRIVQRLDGLNWIHRRRFTGVRHFFRSETGNLLLQTIRSRFSDAIVYQSRFSKIWWEKQYGPDHQKNTIVYNGVDLDMYTPEGPFERPGNYFRLLLVEGSLQGGYETGLETAVELARELRDAHHLPVRLAVAGKMGPAVKEKFEQIDPTIEWLGLVPRADIPRIDRSAHLLFSADLNPACPNSVIEALACGLPVASFDTGALSELVNHESGAIVPYGGDPWKLEKPDTAALAKACAEALQTNHRLRLHARQRAVSAFGLDKMVEGYLESLLDAS